MFGPDADIRGSAAAFAQAVLGGATSRRLSGRDAHLLAGALLDHQESHYWRQFVCQRLAQTVSMSLDHVLAGGWQPSDICAYSRRKLGPPAARTALWLLAELLGEGRAAPTAHGRSGELARLRASVGPPPAAWAALMAEGRTASSGRTAVGNLHEELGTGICMLSFLGQLRRLPVMPPASPTTQPAHDNAQMAKVRALLAKAEATTFPDEADAFLSKAQQLMARYNIERAALEAGPEGPGAQTQARRKWLDEPYVKQKAYLLSVVCQANRGRAVIVPEYGMVTLFGHGDDLDACELLFTSLLVHATKRMKAEVPGANLSAYRRSFLAAYADRIGARFAEAVHAGMQQAAEASPSDLLPVLAERERGADKAVSRMFPNTGPMGMVVANFNGWEAGCAAADTADLSCHPKLA